MQIDKDTQALIDERKKNNAPPLESFTPQELRALRAKMAETPVELQVNISNVDDFYLKGSLGPIKVRKYSNNLSKEPDKKNPLIIYFHGGGFVMGDLESHDLVCRHLCKETNATIIAVDYKLSSRTYKFPAAITDAKDAIAEIIKDADNLQIDNDKSYSMWR